MKTSIPVLAILTLVLCTCKKKDQEPETVIIRQERGYVCENYTCKFVEADATYLTLLDCKSECADTRPGNLEVTAAYQNHGVTVSSTVSVFESADDMMLGVYLDSLQRTTFPPESRVTLDVKNVRSGKYYYNARIEYYFMSYYYFFSKSGSAIVEPGKTTSVTATLN